MSTYMDSPPEGEWCEQGSDWADSCSHCDEQQAIAEDYAEMVREGN